MNNLTNLSRVIHQILSKQRTPAVSIVHASRFGLILTCSVAALEAQATPPAVNALPTGGQVTAGSGVISQTNNKLSIQQHSDRLITDWNSFNIRPPDLAEITLNPV